MTEIHNGDRNAEQELVRRYWQPVFFILERRCGNAELARDICQDTFLVILEKFRQQVIENPDQLAAFIHKTAQYTLIAHNRKEARRQTGPDSELIENCVTDTGSPLSEFESSRIRTEVRKHIEGLRNPRDRDVIKRYYILEQDKEDICRELSLESRHFDKIISRARTRLRKLIESDDGATGEDL